MYAIQVKKYKYVYFDNLKDIQAWLKKIYNLDFTLKQIDYYITEGLEFV